jgi:hypothetical protein
MKTSRLTTLFCLAGALAAVAGQPQPNAKDVERQVLTGSNLLAEGKVADALGIFRKAAQAGNLEGAFLAGDTLFKQAKGCNGRERVLKAAESCGFLFIAATNLHARACVDLSEAFLKGIGQKINRPAAYAWMKVAAQRDAELRADLDRLAVALDPADVSRGQDLAREYLAGRWPLEIARPVDENDPRLKVQGITIGSRPLVVINGSTFAPGDTDEVRPANAAGRPGSDRLTLRCLEIGEDYVLVSITGESHLKLLASDTLASR